MSNADEQEANKATNVRYPKAKQLFDTHWSARNDADIAQSLGIKAPTLSEYKAGKKRPGNIQIAMSLAEEYGIDPAEMLEAFGFDTHKPMNLKSVVIGLGGASCSGKSLIAKLICACNPQEVLSLDLDHYYLGSEFIKSLPYKADNPDAVELNLAQQHLQELKCGHSVEMPQFDFVDHKRKPKPLLVEPLPFIVVEGLFLYTNESLRNLLDIKVWLESPDDLRLHRRIDRDTRKREQGGRGRTLESVLEQYISDVIPGYQEYILPKRGHADFVYVNDGLDRDSPKHKRVAEMLLAYARQLRSPKK